MEMVEVIYLLIFVVMYQAYQIWKLQRNYEEVVDLVVGLHMGDITISEEEDDGY
jgi:hypothetical protein